MRLMGPLYLRNGLLITDYSKRGERIHYLAYARSTPRARVSVILRAGDSAEGRMSNVGTETGKQKNQDKQIRGRKAA